VDKNITEASEDRCLRKRSKTPWELFILVVLGVALISAYGGYKAAKWELEHTVCGSYQTKHAEWHGWLSVKDGISRCFYVESAYPWRVRHGVIQVDGR
jgi:hypothetical protein